MIKIASQAKPTCFAPARNTCTSLFTRNQRRASWDEPNAHRSQFSGKACRSQDIPEESLFTNKWSVWQKPASISTNESYVMRRMRDWGRIEKRILNTTHIRPVYIWHFRGAQSNAKYIDQSHVHGASILSSLPRIPPQTIMTASKQSTDIPVQRKHAIAQHYTHHKYPGAYPTKTQDLHPFISHIKSWSILTKYKLRIEIPIRAWTLHTRNSYVNPQRA